MKKEKIEQKEKVGIADVMPRFLAIGTLSNGKSFRYEDEAEDIKCFINFLTEIYPTFDIDAVINVA